MLNIASVWESHLKLGAGKMSAESTSSEEKRKEGGGSFFRPLKVSQKETD